MKELPILFSTPMVQAILALIKRQTRRSTGFNEVNNSPDDWIFDGLELTEDGVVCHFYHKDDPAFERPISVKSPYGKPGDILWVRETHFNCQPFKDAPLFQNAADYLFKADESFIGEHKWKPSIHMPKEAARIWLKIKDVRVERLHDISKEDAISEGIKEIRHWHGENKHNGWKKYLHSDEEIAFYDPRHSFFSLWEKINGKESLDSNPWVWVVDFEVLSTTGKPQHLETCLSPEAVNG